MKSPLFVLPVCTLALFAGCQNPGGTNQGASDGWGGPIKVVKTANELKAMMDAGGVMLIHTYNAEDYQKRHIPGAVNVDYEKMTAEMLPGQKDKALVFYCLGGMCPVGRMAAQKAANWGFTNAYVYSGGMQDWQSAGMLLVSGGGQGN